jgi:hypothetical protein
MSDNVLNQLRNKRNRATVPPRIDALVPKATSEAQVQNPEILDPSPSEEQVVSKTDTPTRKKATAQRKKPTQTQRKNSTQKQEEKLTPTQQEKPTIALVEEQNPAQTEILASTEEANSNPDNSQTVPSKEHRGGADTLASLQAELQQYPETRRHSAIVLEKDLDAQLTQFCKDRGITVETFLEAAWTVASADNTLVKKITTEAKHRYDRRKRVGQIKRLITMLGNA